MSYTSQNLDNKDWTKPDTVESYNILKGSNPGTAITSGSANTTKELYVRGHGPSSHKAVAESSSSSSASSESSSSKESSSESSNAVSASIASHATSSSVSSTAPSSAAPSKEETSSSSEPVSSAGGPGGNQ